MREAPICVFCGQAITPGQPTTGRPPMAGHAACADAALADDRHWDAIAEASGPHEDDQPAEAQPATDRRAGCLVVIASLGLAILRRS